MPKCTQKCQQNFFLALRIAYYIGKHYRESAARILLTCAVMLRTRTVIMDDRFCPYFGDNFAVFVLETAPSIFHLERNPSNG